MANTTNVITQLRRKNDSGFDSSFFIGSSAKLVSGVRNSGVNNIEENFLIGFNNITKKETLLDGTVHIVREFREESQDSDYYYVDVRIYGDKAIGERWFYGDGLFLPYDETDNLYKEGTEALVGKRTDIYNFISDSLNIINAETPTPIDCVATLYYVDSEQNNIAVAEKTIYASFSESGVITQKQVIANLL